MCLGINEAKGFQYLALRLFGRDAFSLKRWTALPQELRENVEELASFFVVRYLSKENCEPPDSVKPSEMCATTSKLLLQFKVSLGNKKQSLKRELALDANPQSDTK